MEGIISTKLKFHEAKKKFRLNRKPNPNGLKLITSAHNHGLIILALDDTIYAVPTSLLVTNLDGPNQVVGLDSFSFALQLAFSPSIITVAQSGYSSILLATGVDSDSSCPVLEAFDIGTASSGNTANSSLGRLNLNEQDEIVDYAWHPGNETLVALCTRRGRLMALVVCKNQRALSLVYNNSQFNALSCCWSPKGKNLAIGMANGYVRRLEPVFSNKFTFKEKDQSTMTFHQGEIPSGHQVVKLRWINKTYLLSVHANPNNIVDTTYSLFTVKPSNPYRSWKNICFENQIAPNYVVHIANLSTHIVCSPNRSAEVGIIGSETSADDWNLIIIDEEGARIELPLDCNNQEIYPVGLTSTCINIQGVERHVLFFYTSGSLICTYVMMYPENPNAGTKPSAAIIPRAEINPSVEINLSTEVGPSVKINPSIKVNPGAEIPTDILNKWIAEIKKSVHKNKNDLIRLEDVNRLRIDLEEIQEIHNIHKDVLVVVKADIDSLDIGMLEDLYLIEYLKSRGKKKSLDHITLNKIDAVKIKIKALAEKLEELNVHVDLSWEDFARRRKDRRINSLDTIYRTLATNQKIITVLKRRVATQPANARSDPPSAFHIERRELNPSRIKAFKSFLASRSVVPVRRPVVRVDQ